MSAELEPKPAEGVPPGDDDLRRCAKGCALPALPWPRFGRLPAHAGSVPTPSLGGEGPLTVLAVHAAVGPYLPADQIWLRQLPPEDAGRAINRDVLVPRKGGRFAFGRLIDRKGGLVGLLPPGAGEKQEVIADPPWIAVAETLVRKL